MAAWIAANTPIGWRHGQQDAGPVDAAIWMLGVGADAWTQLLLMKKVLLDAGLFTPSEVDGDGFVQRLPARLAELREPAWAG